MNPQESLENKVELVGWGLPPQGPSVDLLGW